jgi:hypothetical protein
VTTFPVSLATFRGKITFKTPRPNDSQINTQSAFEDKLSPDAADGQFPRAKVHLLMRIGTIAHRTTTIFPLASFDSMTRCASWISSKRIRGLVLPCSGLARLRLQGLEVARPTEGNPASRARSYRRRSDRRRWGVCSSGLKSAIGARPPSQPARPRDRRAWSSNGDINYNADTIGRATMSPVVFVREQLADWRNSKRVYFQYHPPADCDGLECGANQYGDPTAETFHQAHIGVRGEEQDTVTVLFL